MATLFWFSAYERRAVRVRWVKAHTGQAGNEAADRLAKEGLSIQLDHPTVTEGGLKTVLEEQPREVIGTGLGRVMHWSRSAAVRYVHLRTGKSNLQAWMHRISMVCQAVVWKPVVPEGPVEPGGGVGRHA